MCKEKIIMAESSSTASISSEFWHSNLVDIQSFTNAFIKKMAIENLPVKATLTRAYKFSTNRMFTMLKVSFQLSSALSITAQ